MKDFAQDSVANVPAEMAEGFDLRQTLWTLWHGRWLVIAVTVLVTVCAAYTLFFAKPLQYAATATVRIAQEQGQQDTSDLAFRRTEAEVIRSDKVLAKVVDALALEHDPAFNRYLRELSPWSVSYWRIALREDWLGLSQSTPDADGIRQKVIANLREMLEVEAPAASQLIKVSAYAGTEVAAARLANAVVDAYSAFRTAEAQRDAVQAASDLAQQIATLDANVELAGHADTLALRRQLATEKLRLELLTQTVTGGVAVVSPASVARFAALPRLPVMVLAGVVGVVLGVVVVFLHEVLRGNVRTGEELQIATGYRVIGEVQRLARIRPRRLLRHLVTAPDTGIGRDMRALRTSLLLRARTAEPAQTICVTAATPGEGVSTIAIGLAQSLAAMRAKVLLIDGNLRSPDLGRKLAVHDLAPADVLSLPMAELSAYVHHHPMLAIDVLAVRPPKQQDPSDIWSQPQSLDSLKASKGLYDHIIIDAGAVLAGPETRMIAHHADMTLFVVSGRRTAISKINPALAQLSTPRDAVALVLNRKSKARAADHSLAHYIGRARVQH